jgi:RNA polymerase sigma-70 factor (ECF subfamily)
MESKPSARFPTTDWGMVRFAQDRQNAQWREAMNRCIAAYWKPVFFFIRAKGHPLHRAEELTQDFFLKFFSRDWIGPADSERGRFRTFLLAILIRFLSDEGAQRKPRQRAFDDRMVAISVLRADCEGPFEPPDHRTPEDLFMREWAKAVMASVHKSLELWCFARGRPDWYRVFRKTYFPAAESAPLSQQELAKQLQSTRAKLRYALDKVHRQFIELLRAEVAGQLGPDDDLDAEIREIESLLRLDV